MKKAEMLVVALAVAITTLWSAPSNALTFNFSFGGGAVTGAVDGLFAGGNDQAATHVFINSSSIGFPFPLPYDTIQDVVINSFDVDSAGNISSTSSFNALGLLNGGYIFVLINPSGPIGFLQVGLNPIAGLVAGSVEFSLTSPVPIPAALPLFASGLGVLGLLGWRRKRKAGKSVV